MILEEEKKILQIDACSRLPYGLKATNGHSVYNVSLNQNIVPSVSIEGLLMPDYNIKPILYPLSSVTEDIFVNGEAVCPMDRLIEAFDFDGYMGLYTTWKFDKVRECVEFFTWGGKVCEMNLHTFYITPEDGKYNSTQMGIRQLSQIFNVFHLCHIDYRNLIGAGLAISALVLDNNPYK